MKNNRIFSTKVFTFVIGSLLLLGNLNAVTDDDVYAVMSEVTRGTDMRPTEGPVISVPVKFLTKNITVKDFVSGMAPINVLGLTSVWRLTLYPTSGIVMPPMPLQSRDNLFNSIKEYLTRKNLSKDQVFLVLVPDRG